MTDDPTAAALAYLAQHIPPNAVMECDPPQVRSLYSRAWGWGWCRKPLVQPDSWVCSRKPGHTGPCVGLNPECDLVVWAGPTSQFTTVIPARPWSPTS